MCKLSLVIHVDSRESKMQVEVQLAVVCTLTRILAISALVAACLASRLKAGRSGQVRHVRLDQKSTRR